MKKLLLTSLLAPATLSLNAASPSNPDILFIFLDDMTFDGINALGNDQISTPNLDKIVKSGVNFQNTYNMGAWNGAVSVASRTQLITGRGLWNAYEAQNSDKFSSLVQNEELWPQVMQNAGYQTYHTGKWHMSYVKPANIFEECETVRPGMARDNYRTTRVGYERPKDENDNSWQPWDSSMGGYWDGGKHWSEVQADLTIDYIERNTASEKPLFISVAFNAPHDPRQSPQKYVDMYPVENIRLPESFQAEHPFKDEMDCGKSLRDEDLAPFPRTEYAVKKHMQEYFAIITHLDDQIGRIMKALKKSGKADNTLIILSADNGLAMGRHGLLGKQSLYEHSAKVPLVIAGCGLPRNQRRRQLVYLQDLVPTVYELIGAEKPENMDFVSLLPIAKDGKAAPVRSVVYGAYLDRQRMVRDNRYKIYFIPRAKEVMLFDLHEDPLEMHNIYGTEGSEKIVRRMARKYRDEAIAVGDTLDMATVYPNLFNFK